MSNYPGIWQFVGLISGLLAIGGLICIVIWAVSRGLNTSSRRELEDLDE